MLLIGQPCKAHAIPSTIWTSEWDRSNMWPLPRKNCRPQFHLLKQFFFFLVISYWMNYFTFGKKISRKIVGIHSLSLQLHYSGMKILVAGILIIL